MRRRDFLKGLLATVAVAPFLPLEQRDKPMTATEVQARQEAFLRIYDEEIKTAFLNYATFGTGAILIDDIGVVSVPLVDLA